MGFHRRWNIVFDFAAGPLRPDGLPAGGQAQRAGGQSAKVPDLILYLAGYMNQRGFGVKQFIIKDYNFHRFLDSGPCGRDISPKYKIPVQVSLPVHRLDLIVALQPLVPDPRRDRPAYLP